MPSRVFNGEFSLLKMGVSWNSIASGDLGKQVVGDDRGHVKTIIEMLAANNADYSPARVALAA